MKEPILRAVAMPPRLFWAPMAPAALNLGLQLGMTVMMQTVLDFNPLWVVVSIALTHSGIVIAGAKEPHLSKMMESRGPFMRSYKSIYPGKGKKLAS